MGASFVRIDKRHFLVDNETLDAPIKRISIPEGTVLITENFHSKVLSREELKSFTLCRGLSIDQRLLIPIPMDLLTFVNASSSFDIVSFQRNVFDYIYPYLTDVFDMINIESVSSQQYAMTLQNSIILSISAIENTLLAKGMSQYSISIDWNASPISDMFADAVVGVLSQSLSMVHILRAMTCRSTRPIENANGVLKRKGRNLMKFDKLMETAAVKVAATDEKKIKVDHRDVIN